MPIVKLNEEIPKIIGGNSNRELCYKCKNYMSEYQKLSNSNKQVFQDLCKTRFGHVVPYEFLKVEMKNIISKKQVADSSDTYYINCFLDIIKNFNK